MGKTNNYLIGEDLKRDYEEYLNGRIKFKDVMRRHNLNAHKLTKLFNILYFEKTCNIRF